MPYFGKGGSSTTIVTRHVKDAPLPRCHRVEASLHAPSQDAPLPRRPITWLSVALPHQVKMHLSLAAMAPRCAQSRRRIHIDLADGKEASAAPPRQTSVSASAPGGNRCTSTRSIPSVESGASLQQVAMRHSR
mmetsp:Transcript_59662/g.136847  ORF Transcript_59662/g.136847 Transcript_59662/m.136847 type:complete len:133 (+) Transcript_59662:29-427(+)